MSLKLAFGGKGGVGKTTITALIARSIAALNKDTSVIAIDADPVANLAAALGIDETRPITPVAELSDLIAERTGAKPGTMGGFFTLNPKVDDIPDRFSLEKDGVKLLVMGTVQQGGSGCICPESTLLRALMLHIVLSRDEVVVMDMEAGIEHLGRATASAVDKLIVVVEPGRRSMDTAGHIKKLASEIGLKNIVLVGNKIRGEKDEEFLKKHLSDFEFLGFIRQDEALIEADLDGVSPYDVDSIAKTNVKEMIAKL